MANAVVDFVLRARDDASQAFDRLRVNASRAIDAIKQKTDQIRYAPDFYGKFLNIPIPRGVGEWMDGVKVKMGTLREQWTAGWKAMGSVANAVGISVSLTAAGVIYGLVRMNTEYQRMQQQLKTFEGSQGAANAVLGDLKRLAVELPFDLKNITQSYIELRAIGIQPTEKMLRDFSDIAAAMGTDIIDIAHGIRRGVAGEFDPLETAVGGTFRVMGNKIRASFRGISEDIGRDASSIIAYLQKIAQTNFAGASQQANTLGMAFSNLGDAIYNAATTLGEAGFSQTVIDITHQLTDLTNAVGQNEVAIRESWGRVVALAVATYQTFMFLPKIAVESARGIAAAIAVVIGTFAVGIEQVVLKAVEIYRKADEWMFQRTNDTARKIEDSLRRAVEAGKAGTQSVMGEANKAQDDVIATTKTAMASWEAVAKAFSDSNHAAIASSVALSQAQTKQFREARDAAQELQALEAKKRAGIKLTTEEMRRDGELRQQLQQKENDMVAEYNKLLAEGDKASLDRRAMLMSMIVQIEQAKNGTLGVTKGGSFAKTGSTDEVAKEIGQLTRLIPIESERARAIERLRAIEDAQIKLLATGNLKLEERAKIYEHLTAIHQAYEAVFRAQLESLALMVSAEGEAANAVRVLEFMERGLKAQVNDTTRSIDDRVAAMKRLKEVESELQKAREAAEADRVSRSIYGTDQERQDAIDHDPSRAPKLPIDTKNNLPRGEAFGRKELGLPTGTPAQIEAKEIESVMKSVEAIIKSIGGKETVWTRMAAGMRRSRTEAEMLKDTLDDIANISIAGLGDAIFAATEAFASGSQSMGRAAGAAMLGMVSQVAQAMAKQFVAMGIASYASVAAPPPMGPNPGGAAAGNMYFAAAAAMMAVSGLAAGASSRVGSGGGGGAGGGLDGIRGVGNELRNAKQNEKVIVLEGDYIDLKDPKSIDRLVHTLGEATDSRAVFRTKRGARRVR